MSCKLAVTAAACMRALLDGLQAGWSSYVVGMGGLLAVGRQV